MERSLFFNAVETSQGVFDRVYKAESFASYFSKFIGNGVFPNPSTGLQVVENKSPDMTVHLSPGYAFINGYAYENDSPKAFSIKVADGFLDRKDAIFIRFDNAGRAIGSVKIEGTPGDSAVPPKVVRTADYWDLCVAVINVNGGVTKITQSLIEDTRMDNSVCGIVHAVVDQIDTTTLYNQIKSDLDNFKKKEQADFASWSENQEDAFEAWRSGVEQEFDDWQEQEKEDFDVWFESIKGSLGSDPAGNLQLQVDKLDKRVSDTESDIYEVEKAIGGYGYFVGTGEKVLMKAKGNRIGNVIANGFTKQSGSGDPSPANVRPIIVAGLDKNLVNLSWGEFTKVGVSVKCENNKLIWSGVASDNFSGYTVWNFEGVSLQKSLAPGKYTIALVGDIDVTLEFFFKRSNAQDLQESFANVSCRTGEKAGVELTESCVNIFNRAWGSPVKGVDYTGKCVYFSIMKGEVENPTVNAYTESNYATTVYTQGETLEQFTVGLNEPLCEGDTVDTNGTERHLKGFVSLTGNENFQPNNQQFWPEGYAQFYAFSVCAAGVTNKDSGKCSHAKYAALASDKISSVTVDNSGGVYIKLPISVCGNTSETIKQYLISQAQNGTPVEIEYELSTEAEQTIDYTEITAVPYIGEQSQQATLEEPSFGSATTLEEPTEGEASTLEEGWADFLGVGTNQKSAEHLKAGEFYVYGEGTVTVYAKPLTDAETVEGKKLADVAFTGEWGDLKNAPVFAIKASFDGQISLETEGLLEWSIPIGRKEGYIPVSCVVSNSSPEYVDLFVTEVNESENVVKGYSRSRNNSGGPYRITAVASVLYIRST